MSDAAMSLSDAEWLAHRHDETNDRIRFVRVERSFHRQVPFITDPYLGPGRETMELPVSQCLGLPADSPVHFVFHSAFCGSTLLIGAMDHQGHAMGLSEPQLLNDIVGYKRRNGPLQAVARAGDAALRLLARPFAPGEAVVIKPSNVVNSLAQLLLGLRPDARAVFLYAPLGTFLASVAHKGLHCRVWARELLEGLLVDGLIDPVGLDTAACFRLSDLQAAAIGWLAQHRLFGLLAERFAGRLAFVDADDLLSNPYATVTAVNRHFGLTVPDETVRAMIDGPLFRKHSKSGANYSAEQRDADYRRVREVVGPEIDMVTEWAGAVASQAGFSLSAVPCPLQ